MDFFIKSPLGHQTINLCGSSGNVVLCDFINCHAVGYIFKSRPLNGNVLRPSENEKRDAKIRDGFCRRRYAQRAETSSSTRTVPKLLNETPVEHSRQRRKPSGHLAQSSRDCRRHDRLKITNVTTTMCRHLRMWRREGEKRKKNCRRSDGVTHNFNFRSLHATIRHRRRCTV